jgi:hypothetical protein
LDEKEAAAVKIQAIARGKHDRAVVQEKRENQPDEEIVQNDDDDGKLVLNTNPKALISDNVYKLG